MSVEKFMGYVLVGMMVFVLYSSLLVLPTWLLWNWLMPHVFGLTPLTPLQAWGLLMLSGLLFKSTVSVSRE